MKIRFTFFILLALGLSGFCVSCREELDDDIAARAAERLKENRLFLPIEIGRQWTYQIDSVYYVYENNVLHIDSISGKYRETVVDTFHKPGGIPVYRIIRDSEDKTTNQWVTTDVFSIEDHGSNFVRTERNLPLIELVFPIHLFAQWNATALLNGYEPLYIKARELPVYKEWPNVLVVDSTLEQVLGSEHIVLSVKDVENTDNIILYQNSQRKYAKGIGLIYKEQAFFTTQRTELSDLPWQQKADVGFEMRQTLIEYK